MSLEPFRKKCEVVVLDGQGPPDEVVEGEGDEDADEAAVLDHQLPVPGSVRRQVLELILVRFAQLLAWSNFWKQKRSKLFENLCKLPSKGTLIKCN